MTNYLIQIDNENRLIKNYVVTEEEPKRTSDQIPNGRVQIIITNETKYLDIVSKYGGAYDYDDTTKEVSIDDGQTVYTIVVDPSEVIDKRLL